MTDENRRLRGVLRERLRVVRMCRPVGCFPMQSYGRTEDGRAVYCRYRHGVLSVQVARNGDEHGARGTVIYKHDDGSGDGCVSDCARWRWMIAAVLDLPDELMDYDERDDPPTDERHAKARAWARDYFARS